MSWRELEAVTSTRQSASREHKKICANEDFRWQSKAAREAELEKVDRANEEMLARTKAEESMHFIAYRSKA